MEPEHDDRWRIAPLWLGRVGLSPAVSSDPLAADLATIRIYYRYERMPPKPMHDSLAARIGNQVSSVIAGLPGIERSVYQEKLRLMRMDALKKLGMLQPLTGAQLLRRHSSR